MYKGKWSEVILALVVTLVLPLVLIVLLISNWRKDLNESKSVNTFGLISEENYEFENVHGKLYKIYDSDTKVMYYYLNEGNNITLCPMYDENGNIMIYSN
jgi:hypothetical protein